MNAESSTSGFRSIGNTGQSSQLLVDQDSDQTSIASSDVQTGVKEIEAISQTWTRRSLICAYSGILFLAICTSLEGVTTTNLTVYATSAFAKHSLVATVLVVQSVVNAVVKPPMAKFANVYGRLEAFIFAMLLYVLGYIQMAASDDVRAFASAQIFSSAGQTGLQILQQIFIADTSDLLNRALFSSLPDIPVLFTVWLGPPLANSLLAHSTWRWGYGIWAIILPTAFLPLGLSLFLNMRKVRRLQLSFPERSADSITVSKKKSIWHELDVMGLLLLSAAISLILIPLTLGATATNKWHNPSIITMLFFGCLSSGLFLFWESTVRLAPYPFLSLRLLRNRSVVAGCALGFFYFAVFYTSVQPYFSSYLQVVHSLSVTAAGHVTQTWSFTATVASVIVSLAIKHTRHYRYFIIAGGCIYLIGVGLMMRYRVLNSSIASIVGAQIALGIGAGMINVPAQLGVQASVSHNDVAAATAIFLTVVEIGGAVGAAVSGAVWTANLLPKLRLYLPADQREQASLIYGNLTLAKSFAVDTSERTAVDRSYQETMDVLLIISLCLAVPILPLSFVMKNYRLDRIDQEVKGTVIGHGRNAQNEREPVSATERHGE